MNSNTQSPHLFKPSTLIEFSQLIYEKMGVPSAHAYLAADTLVQADLWGHQSHGMLRLAWYLARLQSGAMKAQTQIEVLKDAKSIAILDGCHGVGQVIAQKAVEEAVSRARMHGVGVISIRNSNHFGTCMYFTRMCAKQGMIAILMSNAGPNMAPWGGMKKKIGTNPISIAVPGGEHGPIVMDMANSGVARGKIYLAEKQGKDIPLGWALDSKGRPTTNPSQAIEGLILPMAGHKGYVFGVMIDILSGVLSGSGFLNQVHGPYDPSNLSRAGHFLVALDVSNFQPLDEFEQLIDQYIKSLKDVPLAEGHKKVYFPGELENDFDALHRREGLLLAKDTLSSLVVIAKEFNLKEYVEMFIATSSSLVEKS
ncbi:MAG: Ldh family oxidoreductase [Betaproteobacteria bacterium]|jgi:LDH2 family malate/lactate/ureidoglycolate dehydrogenase